MNNQDEATELTIELAKNLVATMQSTHTSWLRAFVRFRMVEEDNWGCNGSYETPDGVFLLGALKHKQLYDGINELGPRLRDATSNRGKKFCVFLLTVDSKFNFNIDYEYSETERWKISKLDGASGLPLGL